MSAIHGLSGPSRAPWPAQTSATLQPAPAGTGSTTPQASPASVVTLSAAALAAEAERASDGLRAADATVWARPDGDAISTLMASNRQASGRFGSMLQGLGAALLTGASDYSQAVYWPSPGTASTAIAPAAKLAGLHTQASNQLSLNLGLRSGTQVTLFIGHESDGLALRFESSAALDEQEGAALAGLAEGFEQALSAWTADTPTLDLAGLLAYDTKAISSLSLRIDQDQPGGTDSSLQLDIDAKQRKLSVDGASGKLELRLDTAQPQILGSPAQREKALAAHTQRFAQAGDAGRADKPLITLLQDAFTQLNRSAPTQTGGAAYERLLAAMPLADHDQAMLSGLADFQIDLVQASRRPNPRRPDEVSHFSYQASQKTEIEGRDNENRTITQQRHNKLEASYHQPLAGSKLMLDDSPASQYYTFHRVEAESESRAQIRYVDHLMVAASLQQQGSQRHEITEYQHGVRTQHTVTPNRYGWIKDLLATLKPLYEEKADSDIESAAREAVLARVNAEVLAPPEPGFLV